MAKRKKTTPRPPLATATSEPGRESPTESIERATARTRWLVSGLILAHFAVLLTSLSANLTPSYLQGKLTTWLAPYTVTTNQQYGTLPLELTHAEPLDFTLELEVHARGAEPQSWRAVPLPAARQTTAGKVDWSRSRWVNLSRLFRLIAAEQPENEILSEIAAQAVAVAEAQSRETIDAVRLVAPKVLSFDEDAIVAAGQQSLIDDVLNRQVIYQARVIHESNGQRKLVPAQAALRTSKPAPPTTPGHE